MATIEQALSATPGAEELPGVSAPRSAPSSVPADEVPPAPGVTPAPSGLARRGVQAGRGSDRWYGRDARGLGALWVIAIVRMASDPATQAYVRRRTQQGLSKREIVRGLKRCIARQLYRLLIVSIAAPVGASITP